jgi:hypothetical protein
MSLYGCYKFVRKLKPVIIFIAQTVSALHKWYCFIKTDLTTYNSQRDITYNTQCLCSFPFLKSQNLHYRTQQEGGKEEGSRQAKPSQEPRQTTPTTGAHRPSRRVAPRSHSRGDTRTPFTGSWGRRRRFAGLREPRGRVAVGSWQRRRQAVAGASPPSRRCRHARPLPAPA